jgi:hypothetical protein
MYWANYDDMDARNTNKVMDLKFSASAALSLLAAMLAYFPCALAEPLEDWVSQQIGSDDVLLCKISVASEYFFVARNGARLKVGSRVRMSDRAKRSHSFSVSWLIQDAQGKYLTTRIPPERLRDEYLHDGPNVFAENVQYQHVNISQGRTFKVAVEISKCAGAICNAGDDVEYRVEVCDGSWK